ncbi:MAG: hypothetical protein IT371_05555 [Deltaproteobacteria bacterium]|nr:hypothetical protein [Deltaproteobacteria bacterium]
MKLWLVLALGLGVVVVACSARAPEAVGRPCSYDMPCGPGTVCDPRQGVCVAGGGGSDFGGGFADSYLPWRSDRGVAPPGDLFIGDAPLRDSGKPTGDAGCVSPKALCDGSCVDTSSDAGHCGKCGNACGSSARCTNSACACTGGAQNCDGSWGNGCECPSGKQCSGSACNAPDPCAGVSCGANASCSGGTCGCNGSYKNCDGSWGNGCECSPTKQCSGTSCVNPDPCASVNCGANATCSGGNCFCNTNYKNCNSTLSDGCECPPSKQCNGTSCITPCTTGSCGANATCTGGLCKCNGDLLNCDGSWTNGCECGYSCSNGCTAECNGTACRCPSPPCPY